MFKKIILTVVILFLLAASALAYFIFTFDAERYRPLIESKAAELTGFPVKLSGVSLTWKNGLALEVRDLVLKVREEDQGPAPVSIRSAYVALEVMPLLQGKLQMGALIVEGPEVRITRSPDGRLRGAAELTEMAPSQAQRGPSNAESTLALLIQNLRIRGGKFIFQDQYGGRVRNYTLDDIELNLRDVSLLQAFPVELKASLFSHGQNLILTGKIHAKLAQQQVRLSDFSIETDLAELDAEKLAEAFPELRESGMPALSGQLHARLSDLTLSEKATPVFMAQIDLEGGRIALPDMEAVENIGIDSAVTADGLELKSLAADWGGGHLAVSSNLDWRQPRLLSGVFQAALSGVDLARAVPASVNPRDPGVSGILSAGLRGNFSGSNADTLMRGVIGDGQVLIKNGVITNLNVLREVLNKLSIIPGVAEKIQQRLSPEYLAKLEERDTRLEDVDIPVRITEGFVVADSIAIQSETLQVRGQAQAALSGPLNGRLFAAIDPEFSMALIRSINELEYIADQSGRITIPITLRGTLQQPQAVPEVQQLAGQLSVAKTQEFISGFLNKKKTGETAETGGATDPGALQPQTSAASTAQPAAQPVDPFAALLGQVLQAATKKDAQQTNAGQ